jgi:hypothetical protein
MVDPILSLPIALRFSPLFIELVPKAGFALMNPNMCSTLTLTLDLRLFLFSCSNVNGLLQKTEQIGHFSAQHLDSMTEMILS